MEMSYPTYFINEVRNKSLFISKILLFVEYSGLEDYLHLKEFI